MADARPWCFSFDILAFKRRSRAAGQPHFGCSALPSRSLPLYGRAEFAKAPLRLAICPCRVPEVFARVQRCGVRHSAAPSMFSLSLLCQTCYFEGRIRAAGLPSSWCERKPAPCSAAFAAVLTVPAYFFSSRRTRATFLGLTRFPWSSHRSRCARGLPCRRSGATDWRWSPGRNGRVEGVLLTRAQAKTAFFQAEGA